MCTKTFFTLAAWIAVAGLLAGCAAPKPTPAAVMITREAPMDEVTAAVMATAVPSTTPLPAPASLAMITAGQAADQVPVTSAYHPNRLIVKNAELKLLVEDTDIAIDRVNQVAADCGGYIISTRVGYREWLGEHYKYASITIGVPVDQFEAAMNRLRRIALRVVDESASGQDVTDEYVDLQSRLDNLIATRDRIRQFLAQAQTVEESLRVNEQLSAIEEQIEQVKGRMNYLFDRSAYSTITVQLDPDLPQPTPAPTPTPTPTPMPWSPTQTVREAGNTLGSILRVLTAIAIWLVIVVLPLLGIVLGPPALGVWLGRRWSRRKKPTDN